MASPPTIPPANPPERAKRVSSPPPARPAAPERSNEVANEAAGVAAESLAEAARRRAAEGDALGAIELYEQASARAADRQEKIAPRAAAAIELALGALYERELGRLDRAIERYERAFKLDPDNLEAIAAGRRLYGSLGDWPRVARLYEVELEVSQPGDARRGALCLAIGRTLAERVHDPVGAAVRLEEAVRLAPTDDGAREALASLYVSPDFPNPTDTPVSLERAAVLFLELAESARARGDAEARIAYLRRALGADPFQMDAAMKLEAAYEEAKRIDELRRLYRLDVPVPERQRKRALRAVDAGDLPEAIEAVVAAAEEGQDTGEVVARIDAQLVEKKELAKVAELHRRLLEAQPSDDAQKDAARWVALAAEETRAGDATRAEASLRAALALDPGHAEARRLLSEQLVARRDTLGLVALAEAAVDAAPLEEQPARLAELAELYEKRIGDAGAAAEAWQRAEAIATTPRGTTELKRLALKEERWLSVTTALERELAGATAPETRADVLRRLAQVCRERHQIDRARTLYESALALRPEDPAAYRALAELGEREGRLDLVAQTLRRQLEFAKEKVERLNLLRRLAVIYDERLTDREGTLWACQQILAALPGDRDALRRLEAAHARAGAEGEEALIAVLDQHAAAAATPTEKAPVLRQLAALYEKRGDPAAAADRLERALKVDKNDAAAQEHLAQLYEKLGKWPEAALLLERLLPRIGVGAPGAVAWKRFARLLDAQVHDAARAQKAWREVLERRPGDHDALEALARIGRERGDFALLGDVLRRRQEQAEGAEAATIAVERALLLEEKLRDRAGALALLRTVTTELDPRNLDALAHLRRMERAAAPGLDGLQASLRVAERELFLAEEPARKLELALEIARAWRDEAKDPRRARLAFERARDLAPDRRDTLAALAEIYNAASAWPELVAVDERRLALAVAAGDRAAAVEASFELALTAEGSLGDPRRAFEYLSRAHAMAAAEGDGILGELRRLAETHGLWEELCGVLATLPGLDARLAVAEIADERMNDPKRALAVARGALDLDPNGTRVLADVERLSVRAGDAVALLEVYGVLLARRREPAAQAELLQRSAAVREQRLNDATGALDELIRAFPLVPEDATLLAEVRRLAEVTGRWDDALALEGARFHRADDAAKPAIAREVAALVEERAKDPLRAFRAYLRALQLTPDDTEVRDHLWRLARAIGTVVEKAPAPSAKPKSSRPARDPTMEVDLDELLVDEGAPEPRAQAKTSKSRRDATVELSLNDLMAIARPSLRPPPPAPDGSASRRPPPVPPAAARPLAGTHTAWDELASVYLGLPAPDEATRFRHLVEVAEMWERGAGDLSRAFDTLASAFLLDPDDTEARGALERLAAHSGAWDRLVAVLDAAIEKAGAPERAVRLLVDSGDVREREGRLDDAEARYHRALGIRPDHEPGLERLEGLYRNHQRWAELAALLERRLGGLMEKLPPGEPRRARALELAEVYERMGKPYEAIAAWTRVADEHPGGYAPAYASLARLYQGVGQWSKVIDALMRELDLVEASGGIEPARELRRRVAAILEQELELPERAIEAWRALDEAGAPEAEAALDRLYTKLGRHADLDELLRRQTARATDAGERAALLERRAALYDEGQPLDDAARAAAVLGELRPLRPDDDALAERLGRALGRAGRRPEQAALLQARIARASDAARPPLYVALAALEAELGDAAAAQVSLERALALRPDDPQLLAELARLRQGGEDWDGYTAAREREGEAAAEPARAAAALVDAARVHLEKRHDETAARRCLERALAREPQSAAALAALGALARARGEVDAADALAARELDLKSPPPPARQAELHAQLGASRLARGDVDGAAHRFREALAVQPGHLPALHGLVDVAIGAGAWDEAEALLRDAAPIVDAAGASPAARAQLRRRLAEALEQQGRSDDAYGALLEADRLQPGDARTRLGLGENRYRANRFREASQHLTALVESAPTTGDIAVEPQLLAAAAYHAALAEQKLRRPDRVLALAERAIALDPRHAEALGLVAERALESGEVARAVELLDRQAAATPDAALRGQRFARLVGVLLDDLKDPSHALAAGERALEAMGGSAPPELIDRVLGLSRDAGRLERAAELTARLLERDAPRAERARRLRELASLEAALERREDAKTHLRAALDLEPQEPEAMAGLSALLMADGAHEQAAQLLTRALPLLPPPTGADAAARAVLWSRLADARDHLRDAKGAAHALEKAIESNPARRDLREALLARYGEDPSHDAAARAHRLVLLADDPLHAPSLRAMARIEARARVRDGGRRFLELLAVAGAINDEERHTLATSTPPDGVGEPPPSALDEHDHQTLAHSDALALGAVFAALWEGAAARTPDLASLGVGPSERVSPVEVSPLAQIYSLCARALGNRKTGLYRRPGPHRELRLVAQPPTAIVVGAAFTDGRALSDVKFILGRALEIARPEYVLAAALSPDDFERLFFAVLRAFHPRLARAPLLAGDPRDDEAAAWKKAMPYKAARRLAELFASFDDDAFSPAAWRRSVQHTGNRAGLLAAGDLVAAARVLNAEGDADGVRELARFAASDAYPALRARLDRSGGTVA
jgi:tetratricopeptide (TPR) repeat protein